MPSCAVAYYLLHLPPSGRPGSSWQERDGPAGEGESRTSARSSSRARLCLPFLLGIGGGGLFWKVCPRANGLQSEMKMSLTTKNLGRSREYPLDRG